jgi:hypothetical protein
MKKNILLFINIFLPFIVFSQTLHSISPSSANAGQTLTVSITGRNTHFSTNGNNTVEFGFGQASGTTVANSTTPISDTILKANITVPAKVYNGTYPVYVKNSTDGSLTLQNVFQVNGNPKPEFAAINPKNGIAGKTLDVTITGRFTHFKSGSNIVTFGFSAASGTTVVNSTTVLSDTTIKVNLTIPSFIATGDYGVSVSNSNEAGISTLSGFHVDNGKQPRLVDINPKNATTKQTLNVTITGTNSHFKSAGSTVTFGFFAQASGTTIINSLNPVNDSSLVVNMTIPPNIQTGNYSVFVNNTADGTLNLTDAFHINQSLPPGISSITPNIANVVQTLNVTIKGMNTHFGTNNGTTVAFYFAQVSGANTNVVNSITVLNDSTLTANITIPSDVYTGDYDFSVKNTTDGPLPIYGHGFHVNGIALPPAVGTNPGGILAGETANITIRGIRGTHFNQPGSKTTVNFVGNRTIAINSKTVINDSIIDLNITAPAIDGGYQLFVTDSIDGQLKGGFKIYPKCLAFFKTTYDVPTNVFTLTLDSLTSNATSFHWDFGDGTTSTDSFPSHVFTEDKIYNVCLQITNTAGDSCRYCHVMGKDSLGNPIFKAIGFSMYAKPYKELITGIPSNGTDEHFISVYPNPADNLITIISSTAISALNKPVLSIYSIEGKLILQQAFVKEKMMLDVSAFQKGMYIMQLTGSKQTEIIKFTKE